MRTKLTGTLEGQEEEEEGLLQEQDPSVELGSVIEVQDGAAVAPDTDEQYDPNWEGQHDLPWEVWVCVLASMKDPRDILSFGLTCHLFHTITQSCVISSTPV
jgi:hypothetical protein